MIHEVVEVEVEGDEEVAESLSEVEFSVCVSRESKSVNVWNVEVYIHKFKTYAKQKC